MRIVTKTALTFLSIATLSTLAACGGDDKPAQDPSAMNTPPPAPPPPPPAPTAEATPAPAPAPEPAKPAEKPLTDAQIVQFTSTANTGEIDMAQLATKQASSADVKSFASMMITQHRDMEAKGKALATKAKITPAESDASTALKSDVTNVVSDLKNQKGKDFDKAYIAAQVKAHTDVLSALDNKLLPAAENGELKTLLTDARTHVAAHLAKAQEIQTKLDSAASTGAAGSTKSGTGTAAPTGSAKSGDKAATPTKK
ncbi:MAG: hypothetical protein JWP97_3608 [Labilithrix sp.]|nr:hypothetical protein [Labilithrix sp.]